MTIFYKQTRLGLNGKPYTIIKFRTMRVGAEDLTGPILAEFQDTRITKLGKWLRKTGLDEFPQIWNILKRDMNLIGPRPERPEIYNQLPEEFRLRLRVRPGLTSLARIRGPYDLDFDTRLKWDLEYIETRNWRLDLWVLLQSARKVLTGQCDARSTSKSPNMGNQHYEDSSLSS